MNFHVHITKEWMSLKSDSRLHNVVFTFNYTISTDIVSILISYSIKQSPIKPLELIDKINFCYLNIENRLCECILS